MRRSVRVKIPPNWKLCRLVDVGARRSIPRFVLRGVEVADGVALDVGNRRDQAEQLAGGPPAAVGLGELGLDLVGRLRAGGQAVVVTAGEVEQLFRSISWPGAGAEEGGSRAAAGGPATEEKQKGREAGCDGGGAVASRSRQHTGFAWFDRGGRACYPNLTWIRTTSLTRRRPRVHTARVSGRDRPGGAARADQLARHDLRRHPHAVDRHRGGHRGGAPCEGPVVTASMDRLHFLQPVRQGAIVIVQAQVNLAARTSMEVGVRVLVEDMRPRARVQATRAYLTFVAVDEVGKPRPVPALVRTDDDRRRAPRPSRGGRRACRSAGPSSTAMYERTFRRAGRRRHGRSGAWQIVTSRLRAAVVPASPAHRDRRRFAPGQGRRGLLLTVKARSWPRCICVGAETCDCWCRPGRARRRPALSRYAIMDDVTVTLEPGLVMLAIHGAGASRRLGELGVATPAQGVLHAEPAPGLWVMHRPGLGTEGFWLFGRKSSSKR